MSEVVKVKHCMRMVYKRLTAKELRDKQINNTIGRRYGHSVVLSFTGKMFSELSGKRSSIYLLRCDCGNTFEMYLKNLTDVSNCGCITQYKRRKSRQKRGSYLPYGETSFNSLYIHYRGRAKYMKQIFTLNKEEFKKLTSGDCTYCGIPPHKKEKDSKIQEKDGVYIYNGIDRVDSSIGYIISNCVSCCEICNKAKRDLSVNDFMTWVLRLVNKYRDGV